MEFIHAGKRYDASRCDARMSFAAREGRSVLKECFGPDCCAFDIDVDRDIRGAGLFGTGHLFTLHATADGDFFIVFRRVRRDKKNHLVLGRDWVRVFLERRAVTEAWAREWLGRYFSLAVA